MQSCRVTFDLAEMDITVIHGFISHTYWAKDIPLCVLEKALQHSLCAGLINDQGEQIAFARMVTDRATFAYLADVFVVQEHQGKGYARTLLEDLFAHQDLQGLRRMMLATRDAHGVYEKFGFTPLSHPATFMQKWDPDVYQRD